MGGESYGDVCFPAESNRPAPYSLSEPLSGKHIMSVYIARRQAQKGRRERKGR